MKVLHKAPIEIGLWKAPRVLTKLHGEWALQISRSPYREKALQKPL